MTTRNFPTSIYRRPAELSSGYIFDLDGTLYLGDDALPGAVELLAILRARGRKVLFLSNNPTKSPDQYVEKLTNLGIAAQRYEVLNTVDTMVSWLQKFHPEATVFPISEQPLIEALTAAGIRQSADPGEIDIVISSFDRTFNYEKLQIAFDAIRTYGRAMLVTTNPDRFCPMPGGNGQPDAAAIVGAIEGCTGTTCVQNVGKPDPFMIETAISRMGLRADQCTMVGDRLLTDIQMGIDAGMATALVLTGETTPQLLESSPIQPTWVLKRVDHLLPETAVMPNG